MTFGFGPNHTMIVARLGQGSVHFPHLWLKSTACNAGYTSPLLWLKHTAMRSWLHTQLSVYANFPHSLSLATA